MAKQTVQIEIAEFLKNKKAKDIVLYEISENVFKNVIICTISNNIKMRAIAKEMSKKFETSSLLYVDGVMKGEWVVFDFNSFVVHMFLENTREKFEIEKQYKVVKIVNYN